MIAECHGVMIAECDGLARDHMQVLTTAREREQVLTTARYCMPRRSSRDV